MKNFMKKFILGFLFTLVYILNINAQTYRPIRGRLGAPVTFNFTQKANTDTVLINRAIGRVPDPRSIDQAEDKDEDSLIQNRPRPIDRKRSKIFPIPTSKNLRTVLTNYTSPNPIISFNGVMDAARLIPPDLRIAAGDDYIIQTSNQEINIYSKGGILVSRLSTQTFFNPGGQMSRLFDPHIVYDATERRWVGCINGSIVSNGHIGTAIVVSTTSDPLGNWYSFYFDAASYCLDVNDFVDYPLLGYNKNWIVITDNIFSSSSVYGATYVLDKNSLYNGRSTVSINAFITPDGFGTAPAETQDSTQTTEYLVDNWSGNINNYGYVRLRQITGTVISPVLSVINQIGIPQTWNDNSIGGAQRGGRNRLELIDTRIGNLVYKNNSLWFAHNAFLPTFNPDHTVVQWWQIDPTTSTVQQFGRIEETDTVNSCFFFPCVAVNDFGDVLISHGKSSSTMYASACYSIHAASDPINYTRTYYPYKEGVAYYFKDFGYGRNRWGDYFGAAVDPRDNSFWVTGEWANTNNMWATAIANVPSLGGGLTIPCPSVTGLTPSNITDTSVTLSWNIEPSAVSYNVLYRPVKTTLSPWIIVSSPANTINLTGLIRGTTYQWKIQSLCSQSSSFSNETNFTTSGPVTCLAPTDLSINISNYPNVVLNWVPSVNSTQHLVKYRVLGTNIWKDTIPPAFPGNTITLTDIPLNTTYEWKVLTNCSGTYSVESYTSSFKVLATDYCVDDNKYGSFSFILVYPSGYMCTLRGWSGFYNSRYFEPYSNFSIKEYKNLNNGGQDTIYNIKPFSHSIVQIQKICIYNTEAEWAYPGMISTPPYDFGGSISPKSSYIIIDSTHAKITFTRFILPNTYTYINSNRIYARYRIKGTTNWTYKKIDISSTNIDTLINLLPSTTYEFQSKGVVGIDSLGLLSSFLPNTWEPIIEFKTLPLNTSIPSLDPSEVLDIKTTSVSLNPSTSGIDSTEILYRTSNTNPWATKSFYTQYTSSLVLDSLTPSTNYEIRYTVGSDTSQAIFLKTLNCREPDAVFTTKNYGFETVGTYSKYLNASRVRLNWRKIYENDDVLSYNIRYKPISSPSWSTISAQTTPIVLDSNNLNTIYPDSIILTSLIPNTTYIWQVQSVCPTTTSNYTALDTFYTKSCNFNDSRAYTFPGFTGYTSVYIILSDTSLHTVNIRYRKTSDSTWTYLNSAIATYNPIYGNQGNQVQITGLTQSTWYQCQVQKICTGGDTSEWVPIFYSGSLFNGLFETKTPSPCIVSINLISNITSTGVNMYFSTYPNIPYNLNNITIRYRVQNTSTWSLINLPNNVYSYIFTNLTPNTTYEVQTIGYCSYDTSYSPSLFFTTLPPPCITPSPIITSITSSNASTNWNSVPGALSYNIQYTIYGTNFWFSISTPDTFYTFTGLTAGVRYEWKIQSNCGGGNTSPWSNLFNFQTSNGCDIPYSLVATNITPTNAVLNWSAISGATIYYVTLQKIGSYTFDTFYSLSNSIDLRTFTSSGLISPIIPGETYEWSVVTGCSNGVYSPSSPSSTFTTPALLSICPTPAGTSTYNVTSSSATLSWGVLGGVIEYNIRYRIVGTSTWTTDTSSNASKLIIGLTPGTNYEWQVQSDCGGGSVSLWTSSNTFTTSIICNTPSSLTTTNITSSSADLNWGIVNGATGYNIQYRILGTNSWTATTSSTTFKSLTGLTSGVDYEWQVQTICSGGNSTFSISNIFTTSCDVPTSLNTINITSSTATLNWGAASGAIIYNIQYKVLGSSSWTTDTSSTTSKSLTGLTPGVSYEWQVQTVCSNGNSLYSSSNTFTTSCPLPSSLSASSVTSSSANLSWGAASGAVFYNIRYRIVGSSSWTTDTSSTTSKSLTGLSFGRSYEWQVQTFCLNGISLFTSSSTFTTICPIPTSLTVSNITSSSADLSWGALSGVLSYNIQYRVVGGTVWTTVSSITNSYTLTNLTSPTNYEWQVQTVCLNGILSSSASSTFTTPCDIPLYPTANSITSSSVDLSWTPVPGATLYNIRYRVVGAGVWTTASSSTNVYLVTGLTSGTNYEWQVQTVCSNGTSSFSSTFNFTTSCPTPTSFSTTPVTTTSATLNWGAVTGAANYNIRFRVIGTSNWTTGNSIATTYRFISGLTPGTNYEWQVQSDCGSGNLSPFSSSITFTTSIICNTPASLTTTSITSSSADLNWGLVYGASTYNLRYRVVGAGTWITTTSSTNSKSVTGLSSSSNYEWQVQADCGGGNTSSFSSSSTFTTSITCNAPTSLTTSNLTSSTVTLNWGTVSGAFIYNIQYRVVGTLTWTTDTSIAISKSLTGLTPGLNYEWQVQTNCGSGNLSPFSSSNNFTTYSLCRIPTILSTTLITSSTAKLNWGAVSGVSVYNIQYRIVGANFWTSDTSTTTYKSITGLTSGTNYEWQVQTNCGYESSSFSTPITFVTLCDTPNTFTSTSITSSSANLSWGAVSGVSSYNLRYRVIGTSNWINIISSINSYTLTNLTPGTNYEWQVQTLCVSGISSFSSSSTFTTSCDVPTSLNTTSITTTNATLNWVTVSGATSYNLRYRVVGAGVWTTTTSSTNSKSLIGLVSGTNYEWQVQTVCASGNSSFTSSSTFTTLTQCSIPSSLTTTNITSSSADLNWGIVNGATGYNIQYREVGTNTWVYDVSSFTSKSIIGLTPNTNYEFQIQSDCGGGNISSLSSLSTFTTLIQCDVPDSLNVTNITFSSATLSWGNTTGNILYNIRYRVLGTNTWVVVSSQTNSYNIENLTLNTNYEWQVQTVCGSGINSSFSSTNTFITSPICPIPTSLTTTNITSSSADLNWDSIPGASSYNIRYKTTGSNTWTIITILTNTYSITGINPGTDYEWQVQLNCGNNSSLWSSSSIFTTLIICNTPSSLTTTNITSSSAILNWGVVSGAVRYNIQYRIVGTGLWISATSTTNSKFLTGLNSNTSYEFQVQSDCGSMLSLWSSSSIFTISVLCNIPISLSTTSITTTSATLNWGAVSIANSYNIQYRITGTSTWITTTSLTNSKLIQNLTPNTQYEFQVQSDCGGGNTSLFSSSSTFTTLIQCNTPTSLTTSNITSSSAILNWGIVNGSGQYNIRYRIVGTNTWANVTSISNFINIIGLTSNTNYEWQIQSDCGGGNISLFSSLNTFTTLIQCNIPTSFTTTNITSSGATLNWGAVSGAISYNIQYRVIGTNTWVSTTSTFPTKSLTGLNSNTQYEWQVQTNCGGGNISSFSSSIIFTTSLCANPPSSLTTTNITTSSATLGWGTVNGAIGYNIQYRVIGTNVWNSVVPLTNSISITNLTPNTQYEWQVQTNCGGGNISLWSSSSIFTTLIVCTSPGPGLSSDNNCCGFTATWTSMPGATAYKIYYKTSTATTWSTITTSTASNTYTFTNLSSLTGYYWTVQTICSGGVTSTVDLTQYAIITTTGPCTTPTSLTATNITATSAKLGWGKIAKTQAYNIRYRVIGSTTWIIPPYTINNYSTITGLTTSTNYEFQIQAICTGSNPSLWSASKTFKTL